LTIFISD